MRLVQLEEEMRPENIERTLSTYGTTRTVENRETRRRVSSSEKRGVEICYRSPVKAAFAWKRSAAGGSVGSRSFDSGCFR
jgi:hypothetical protein